MLLAGKSLKGVAVAGMEALQADVAKEQALYMYAVHRIGRAQYREALQLCLPAAREQFEVSCRDLESSPPVLLLLETNRFFTSQCDALGACSAF